MAEWLNNRTLQVSVGYTRRGNDEDDGAARSKRRAYTSIRMLISEQSSR